MMPVLAGLTEAGNNGALLPKERRADVNPASPNIACSIAK
jgi:hypothetical protein